MIIRKLNIVLSLLAILIIVGGCNETDPTLPTSAIRVTYSDILITPGDEWFKVTYDVYEPSPLICGQITAKLQTANYKFCIFSRLASACSNTQMKAAESYKTLKNSGVPDSLIEIYSMQSISIDQPYMTEYSIKSLPSLLIIRQNKPIASVLDTLERNDSTKKIPVEIYINSFMSK